MVEGVASTPVLARGESGAGGEQQMAEGRGNGDSGDRRALGPFSVNSTVGEPVVSGSRRTSIPGAQTTRPDGIQASLPRATLAGHEVGGRSCSVEH